jgi:hypothetical protein
MDFTPSGALQAAQDGRIEAWVDAFLRTEGKNVTFADGLKLSKRYWLGPIEVPLNILVRICGPEPEMEYKETQENWDHRVEALVSYIKGGGKPFPPLLVRYRQGILTLSDGSHRHGAFEKMGIKKYWVLLWCSKKDLSKLKAKFDL